MQHTPDSSQWNDPQPGVPGSPDGPPAPEKRSLGEQLGMVTAILLSLLVSTLLILASAWGVAWLITNFPSFS